MGKWNLSRVGRWKRKDFWVKLTFFCIFSFKQTLCYFNFYFAIYSSFYLIIPYTQESQYQMYARQKNTIFCHKFLSSSFHFQPNSHHLSSFYLLWKKKMPLKSTRRFCNGIECCNRFAIFLLVLSKPFLPICTNVGSWYTTVKCRLMQKKTTFFYKSVWIFKE